MAPPNLTNCTRSEIIHDFVSAWGMTEALFSGLRDEPTFLRPPVHGLRHPLAFYYGHSAVFYINKFLMAGLIERGIDSEFENLFAIGVDENSWDDMSKNENPWPSLETVRTYRQKVYDLVLQTIEARNEFGPSHETISNSSPAWAVLMCIEHERIHIETTSVLIREMAIENLKIPVHFPLPHTSRLGLTPTQEWVPVPGGTVEIGKALDSETYGWDCEYGNETRKTEPFFAAKYLTTNGEMLEFVKSGGYQNSSLWTEEGWAWKEFRKRNFPMFWVATQYQQFLLRTCFEEVPLPLDWPVVVNFHEAKAFASWLSNRDGKSYRLMSEAEHNRLRAVANLGTGSAIKVHANSNLRFGSESPVNEFNNDLVCDLFGNLWQWCEDIFKPLNGFKIHPLYPDYSEPCFDDRHQVLIGGSFATSGVEAGPWNRNNFRRHFYQHAGFRLVRPS